MLEWRFERTPPLLRSTFASLPAVSAELRCFGALAGLVLIAFVHSIMIEFPDLSDFGRMDPEPRSWNANWNYHSEMSILRVVDRFVAMLDGP